MVGLRTYALVIFLSMYWHHVLTGTLFADPGDNVFFNISIKNVTSDFFALERSPDEKHKVMVFLNRLSPPDISDPYQGRINYTGNIKRMEINFMLYNVSIEDAGEYRIVPVGIRKVIGSQILAVAGRPDDPIIVEKTIPQVNKDHILECKTRSNSQPVINGFTMSFTWKRNGTVLSNNSFRTVQGKMLIIRRLQREDRFDKYSCIAYDSDKLLTNESEHYQIDPKYGPTKVDLDPSNKTYFVEEGFKMANITCSADCHPPCNISWDRDMIHAANLYLGLIDKEKSGMHRCKAQNPLTNVTLTAELEVVMTSETNCSCLLQTCEKERCPSHDTQKSGQISNDYSTYKKIPSDGIDERVKYAVIAAGALFACICFVILFACFKNYRFRHVKSCSAVIRLPESNVNVVPREGQESDEMLDDEDRYSTIDEVFPKEIVPPAETSSTSESFRKKRTFVRYTRQPSVSSRRASSTVDSAIEEEINTQSSNGLQDNIVSEETSGLIYIQPHFTSSED